MEPSPTISPQEEAPVDVASGETNEPIVPRASVATLAGLGVAGSSQTAPQRFDFRQPAFLPPAEMRNLRKHHAEFIEKVTASLANYLRAEVLLEITRLQTVTYRDFVASLRSPAHLTLLKVEPLRGICIVDLNPKLGLAVVDRLLGGTGAAVEQSRDLSEIETALLDQVVQLIVTEWCQIWEKGKEIRPLALAHESAGQFLQTSPPETTMLLLAMEARVGECAEQIQVVFPWTAVEPLFGQLAPMLVAGTQAHSREPAPPKWRSEFAQIPLQISAHGPALDIAARDLGALQLGDMLTLDAQFANQISVRVGDVAKFTGRLGTSGGKWAVEITAIQNR